jgi:flagellar hook-associated protein 2
MTNSINLAALGFGGIDTSTLVSSLVNLEQQPVTALQTEQTNIQNASSTISSFAGTLSSLSGAVTALADPTSFAAMGATSSDSSIVATASGSPPAGQWSVSVSQIAQEQRTMSNGSADTTSALGLTGTLGITMGNGQTASITVTAGESLSDVANALSQSGLPLQASTFYDGSQYHLLVSGTSTGAANSITFDESGLTGSGYTLGLSTASNTIQAAQDASLTVGGVPITSATNLVSNAIPGVSLAITQPTTQAATITIASNTSAVATQIQAFVTAYNAVVTAGHTDAGFGTVLATNTLLQGDEAVRSTLDQLSQLVAQQVPGATGTYDNLGSVGVELNDDGTLSFDQSAFTAAMQADPTSVTNLFASASDSSSGIMSSINSTINSLTDPTDGAITAELDSFSSRNTELTSQISTLQIQVTSYQTQLQAEFTAMNTQLEQYKNESSALTEAFDASTGTSNSSSTSSVV